MLCMCRAAGFVQGSLSMLSLSQLPYPQYRVPLTQTFRAERQIRKLGFPRRLALHEGIPHPPDDLEQPPPSMRLYLGACDEPLIHCPSCRLSQSISLAHRASIWIILTGWGSLETRAQHEKPETHPRADPREWFQPFEQPEHKAKHMGSAFSLSGSTTAKNTLACYFPQQPVSPFSWQRRGSIGSQCSQRSSAKPLWMSWRTLSSRTCLKAGPTL